MFNSVWVELQQRIIKFGQLEFNYISEHKLTIKHKTSCRMSVNADLPDNMYDFNHLPQPAV